MSALAITEAVDTGWALWPAEAPAADLALVPAPAVDAPRPADTGWQLTDRGVAVAVVTFLAVLLTAAVVLVGAFLAVPERPVTAADAAVAALSLPA